MNNLLSGRSGVKRQERNMKRKRLVDKERMAKKRARNAITALGHFLTLVCQVQEYRDRLKSMLQVWCILYLLLLPDLNSASTCLQHSRNLE